MPSAVILFYPKMLGNMRFDHINDLLRLGAETDSPYIQKVITALTTLETASQYKNRFYGGGALDLTYVSNSVRLLLSNIIRHFRYIIN